MATYITKENGHAAGTISSLEYELGDINGNVPNALEEGSFTAIYSARAL
jgi:hypothetical protein